MKRLMYVLPLTLTMLTVSCSGKEAPEGENDATEQQEEVKPLVEREPEVKDYLDITKEMVDEYVTVGENLLTTMEKLDAGELGMLESATAVQELLESWDAIDELSHSLEQQEGLKKSIEKKLNKKDMIEFTGMYLETIQRMDSLRQRIESSDLNKYL